MKKFQILPHTADTRLRVEGDTLENLFSAALEGMADIIRKDFCNKSKEFPLEFKLKIKSLDSTNLLVDFLSEVLTLSHVHNSVFCNVTFDKLTTQEISAKIIGIRVNKFSEDIKAVTYHGAKINKNDQGNYQAVIIFDI